MVCKAGQLCLIKFFRFSKAEDIILTNDRVLLYESTSVKDLFAYIEVNCQIPAGSFNLNFASADILTDLSEMKDKTMSEIGMDFSFDPDSTENKHILLITDPDNAEQKQTEYPTVVPASPHRSSVWGEDNVDFKSFIKSETSYVGLVNQAMTCYLNSLLQALYMTPEFRNALYNWEYVKGSEEDEVSSIPYQLQKLFLNLQTSTKSAVETTALTKSFGWDSTQAWQQHDIQELCRVMFDALEENFQNTEQADLINSLYEGKMTDYVKCLECGTEKSREDTFLDIPLPVRPFGSNVAYDSVEEALRAFVQYETLEGNNQYHCEKCNKKCDAHKGLKFTKFPYLLTLHLKRFDFDFKTFHRIKLNDKVTFPDILNLSPFISSTTSQESPSGDENINLVKCDDSSTTDSGTLDDDYPSCENSLPNSNHSTNHDQDDDEGIDVINSPSTSNCTAHSEENEENHDNNSAEEPFQYELFSIMIHSGSASGGHYYAYIKDFRTQEWLSFNDQSVTQITHDDIQKTYGGGSSRPYYSGAYSSTTAYMLMYRQIDPVRNTLPMQVQDFPKHIQELLKKMKENEHSFSLEDRSLLVRSKKRSFESRRRMSTYDVITTKVYVVDVSKKKIINGPLNVRALRTETVREYKQIIGKLFEMNPDEIKLVLRKNETDTVLLQNDDAELLSTEFPNPVNVFVLTMFDTNEYEPFYETAMYEFIENFENIITVHVNLPDISKEILEELNIPTLEEKYKDKEKPIAKSPSNVSVNELHRDNGPKSNEVPSAKNGKSNEDAPIRNTSPQLGEGEEWNTPEQSNSEDSSLSDSDKTLVGDAPEDDDFQLPYLSSSTSNCAIEMLNQIGLENTDNSNDDSQYYFQVTPYMTNKLKFLKVLVDKRMKLSTLKKRLEPYVGVSAEYFKIFNHFQDTGESDCDYLLKHLVSYDDAKLYITLHRALRDGEFAVKLYQFAIDSQDPYKFLCEWIISKGMTVGQTKKEILAEIKRKYDIDIPYERCRLRKKTFRLASEVFLDDQKLDDSLFYLQREMIIQELPDKEPVTSSDQIVLFVRRWSPSEMKLGPLQEIVIDEKSIDEMRKKLALISDIPVKHIGVERAMVTVPTNVSFPRIQHDVKWQGNTIDELLDIENGVVILYKDNRETSTNHQSIKHQIPLAELYRNFPFSSVRKEKALKIHMGAK